MSRVIRVMVTDSDYERIISEHPNLEREIREYLGCSEVPDYSEDKIIEIISDFPKGEIFTYRDVYKEIPDEMTGSICAKIVRRICKEKHLAEYYGFNSSIKMKTYKRL